MLKIVYGMDVEDMNDDYIQLAQIAMDGLGQSHIPGAHWVEYFPILRHLPLWFPGARFRRTAEKFRPYVEDMVQKPYDDVLHAAVSMPPLFYRRLTEGSGCSGNCPTEYRSHADTEEPRTSPRRRNASCPKRSFQEYACDCVRR